MQTTTDTAIERELAIAARPETVWEFLVDPRKATRWIGMSARLDPRPGGEYRVDVCPGESAHGWDHYLPRLTVAASGADPGPDPWAER